MNLGISYYSWFQGQINRLSPTNIYDQPLVCGNQLHYEDMKRKTKHENIQCLQSWSSHVGLASENSKFGWWDGRMRTLNKCIIHMWEFILVMVKGSFTGWWVSLIMSLNANYETSGVGCLPTPRISNGQSLYIKTYLKQYCWNRGVGIELERLLN